MLGLYYNAEDDKCMKHQREYEIYLFCLKKNVLKLALTTIGIYRNIVEGVKSKKNNQG